jgi:hypothetical protein
MGGSGVGVGPGGGSRGASLGGRGMRAMLSPPSIHHESKSLLGRGGCERCAPLGPPGAPFPCAPRQPWGNVGSSLAQPQAARARVTLR